MGRLEGMKQLQRYPSQLQGMVNRWFGARWCWIPPWKKWILTKVASSFLWEAMCNQTFRGEKRLRETLGLQTLRQGLFHLFMGIAVGYKPNINHKKEECPSPLAKHSNFESPKSQAALLRQKSQPNIHLFWKKLRKKVTQSLEGRGEAVWCFFPCFFFSVEVQYLLCFKWSFKDSSSLIS